MNFREIFFLFQARTKSDYQELTTTSLSNKDIFFLSSFPFEDKNELPSFLFNLSLGVTAGRQDGFIHDR